MKIKLLVLFTCLLLIGQPAEAKFSIKKFAVKVVKTPFCAVSITAIMFGSALDSLVHLND